MCTLPTPFPTLKQWLPPSRTHKFVVPWKGKRFWVGKWLKGLILFLQNERARENTSCCPWSILSSLMWSCSLDGTSMKSWSAGQWRRTAFFYLNLSSLLCKGLAWTQSEKMALCCSGWCIVSLNKHAKWSDLLCRWQWVRVKQVILSHDTGTTLLLLFFKKNLYVSIWYVYTHWGWGVSKVCGQEYAPDSMWSEDSFGYQSLPSTLRLVPYYLLPCELS